MDIHADIHVRPLRRDEAEVLDRVFAGLSPQSRHLRFHSPIPQLTAPVRRALLAVDGRDHVALVAMARGEPVGIARLIRDPVRSHEAEIAFEVVDAWQRRGVGRRLMIALMEALQDRRGKVVESDVLATNRNMLDFVTRLGFEIRPHPELPHAKRVRRKLRQRETPVLP